MAWTLLKTDYKDAVFEGKRKFTEIVNQDGSKSFDDVTNYTVKQDAFFGASDANRINEAVNAIMAALEGGTDLYEVFQQFFEQQKQEFADEADAAINPTIQSWKDTVTDQFAAWWQAKRAEFEDTDATGIALEIENNGLTDLLRYYGIVGSNATIATNDATGVTTVTKTDDCGSVVTTITPTSDTVTTVVAVVTPTAGIYKYTVTTTITVSDSGTTVSTTKTQEAK